MDQLLDSYQNPVGSPPRNESVEAISSTVSHVNGYMEVADIYSSQESPWQDDEDAERIASDLSSDRAEGDAMRRSPAGHGSGDRNEPGYAHHKDEPEGRDTSERGRASSGESFEDEADNALFRQPRS